MLEEMARPRRVELLTSRSVVRSSCHVSQRQQSILTSISSLSNAYNNTYPLEKNAQSESKSESFFPIIWNKEGYQTFN